MACTFIFINLANRVCAFCGETKTPQWRAGTLCPLCTMQCACQILSLLTGPYAGEHLLCDRCGKGFNRGTIRLPGTCLHVVGLLNFMKITSISGLFSIES